MICGFCGHLFDENEGKKGCGVCPGGCHSVHCPRCNYKNPLEPDLIKYIKKISATHYKHADKGVKK